MVYVLYGPIRIFSFVIFIHRLEVMLIWKTADVLHEKRGHIYFSLLRRLASTHPLLALVYIYSERAGQIKVDFPAPPPGDCAVVSLPPREERWIMDEGVFYWILPDNQMKIFTMRIQFHWWWLNQSFHHFILLLKFKSVDECLLLPKILLPDRWVKCLQTRVLQGWGNNLAQQAKSCREGILEFG